MFGWVSFLGGGCHHPNSLYSTNLGGQPDFDMKVDFGEIGIGKIGISDFLTSNFVFSRHREQKIFCNFLFFPQNPLQLYEYLFLS